MRFVTIYCGRFHLILGLLLTLHASVPVHAQSNMTIMDHLGIGADCDPSSNLRIKDSGTTPYISMETNDGVNNTISLWEGNLCLGGSSIGHRIVFRSMDGFGSSKVTIREDGNLGIGTTIPQAPLHVVGDQRLRGSLILDPATTHSEISGTGRIYADDTMLTTEVWVEDGSGQATQISSHRDPRSVSPQARTSFSDPSVKLPFSFHHKNVLLGQGEVVDLAKVSAYVEKKMQAELGTEAGRVIYSYELPATEHKALEEHQAERIIDHLKALPWVKAKLGANRQIPPEAVEVIDEVKDAVRVVFVNEDKVDFDSMRIITVKEEKTIRELKLTGRKIKRFKPGWELRGGELYHEPTLDDIDLEAALKSYSQLPLWIRDRLEKGKQDKQKVSEAIKKISEIIQAKNETTPGNQLSLVK